MARRKQAEFIKWFGPLLEALRDLGDSGKPREVSDKIASNLNLPDEVLDETLKSGGSRFHNQVAWARQYLVWEGLLDSSKHGTWKLTEKGKNTSLSLDESREIFLKWVTRIPGTVYQLSFFFGFLPGFRAAIRSQVCEIKNKYTAPNSDLNGVQGGRSSNFRVPPF
jgi:hypothetical protein